MTAAITRFHSEIQPSHVRTAADFARSFPTGFESRREFLFHPARPERIACDIFEIGPGRGDFLLAMANAYPEKQFIAVEIGKKRHFKLARRIDERGLRNILLIQGDARFVLPRCIPESSVTVAYILFPDPWPKRRDAFRRLLTTEFLTHVGRILRPGGVLTLKTDVASYADWVVNNARSIPLLDMVSSSGAGDVVTVETLYEQRRLAGETVHTLCWQRLKQDDDPATSQT